MNDGTLRLLSEGVSPEELLREAIQQALDFDPVAAKLMGQGERADLAVRLALFIVSTEDGLNAEPVDPNER